MINNEADMLAERLKQERYEDSNLRNEFCVVRRELLDEAAAALAKQQAHEATAERKTHCDACNTPGACRDMDYKYCPPSQATAEPAAVPVDAESLQTQLDIAKASLEWRGKRIKELESALAAQGTQKAEQQASPQAHLLERGKVEGTDAVAERAVALHDNCRMPLAEAISLALREKGFTTQTEDEALQAAADALARAFPSAPQAAPTAQAEPMSALQVAYDRLHEEGFRREEDWFIRGDTQDDAGECVHIDTIAILAEAGIKEKP